MSRRQQSKTGERDGGVGESINGGREMSKAKMSAWHGVALIWARSEGES
jgi:hypothetical protein